MRTMKKVGLLAGVVALLTMTGAAQAAGINPQGFYVGGAVGLSYTQDLTNITKQVFNNLGAQASVSGDQTAFAGGLFVGAEINRNFEARLGYTDLGNYSVHANTFPIPYNATIDGHWSAYTTDLLIKAPIQTVGTNPMSAYLKLSAAFTKGDFSMSDNAGTSDSVTYYKTIFVPGIGLKIDSSSNIGATFEIDYYHDLAGSGDGDDINMFTFMGGMFLRF